MTLRSLRNSLVFWCVGGLAFWQISTRCQWHLLLVIGAAVGIALISVVVIAVLTDHFLE